MLSMTNISKVFRTDLIETHALRDFSLEVKAGEFLAVTGPSGSGKTTFLNITGLLEPYDSGTYKLDGVDVTSLSDDARSHLRNQKIGFIFQSFNLMPDLNVYDNVDVPLRYRRMKSAERDQPHHQCARDRRSRRTHEAHSGAALGRPAAARGHRARHRRRPQAGARGRAHRQPGFPDGAPGLDLLEKINEMGTTIIMVTHDPELARRAHRNVQVVDGQISDFKPYEPHGPGHAHAQARPMGAATAGA